MLINICNSLKSENYQWQYYRINHIAKPLLINFLMKAIRTRYDTSYHKIYIYIYIYIYIRKHQPTLFLLSYEGKLWILVGEDDCGGASYLQPESEEVGNWNYKRNQFYKNEVLITGFEVAGIEVADINQDGYTEIFIASYNYTTSSAIIKEYSFSNGKVIVTDPPSTSPTSSLLRRSSTISSSSIRYLDPSLPILIGQTFLLRLL